MFTKQKLLWDKFRGLTTGFAVVSSDEKEDVERSAFGEQQKEKQHSNGDQDDSTNFVFWIQGKPKDTKKVEDTPDGMPGNLPATISPLLWGGIAVKTAALKNDFEKQGMWPGQAWFWGSQITMALVVATLRKFIDPVDDEEEISLLCVTLLYLATVLVAIVATSFLQRRTTAIENVWRAGLHQIANDLTPILEQRAGLKLTFTVEDDPDSFMLNGHKSFLSLVPLRGGTSTDDNDCSCHKDIRPLSLWTGDKLFVQDNDTAVIDVHCPWFYPMLFSKNVFQPRALQGHDQVDMFSWGLVYVALEKIVHKRSWMLMNMGSISMFVWIFWVCIVRVSSLDLLRWKPFVAILLTGAIVIPSAVVEVVVVCTNPSFHRKCRSAIDRVAPTFRAQCGYDLEYKVIPSWFLATTSELHIFPIKNRFSDEETHASVYCSTSMKE